MKSHKILISCYACSPYKGSEPGMGWSFVKGISKFHDVHVIVEEEKWKTDINKYLDENPEFTKNLNFYFIRKKRNRKLRKIWPPSYYYFYRQWQKEAFELAKNLHKEIIFDLVHQLNMVGFREPGYLWKMDLPFVWGPIGGMQNTPWSFFSEFDLYGKLFYGGRNLLNSMQMVYLKRPKRAALRKNNCLIAATHDNKDSIYDLWNKEAEIIAEVGSKKRNLNYINKRKSEDFLNIVWSGQHTSGKALNILLKSLSKLPVEIKWTLNILGKGQMTEIWQRKSEDLAVDKNCIWHGWLPKNEAINIMAKGHLFCITSLLDLTSSVTLEAISYGLPIICLDHHGFSHVVTKNCGIKIPVTTPHEAINGFLKAIEKLYYNESLRQELAKGALIRAQDFSWEKKIGKLNKIYNRLLE